MARKSSAKPAASSRPTRRKGDRHYDAPDGSVWDSLFEYKVYLRLADEDGIRTRRTVPGSGDTFIYFDRPRSAICRNCGSDQVVQQRSYTPDLFCDPVQHSVQDRLDRDTWVEAKGYLRGHDRRLLRCFVKERPDVNLWIIFQRDYYVTKPTAKRPGGLRITEWAAKYLKGTRVSVWPNIFA